MLKKVYINIAVNYNGYIKLDTCMQFIYYFYKCNIFKIFIVLQNQKYNLS